MKLIEIPRRRKPLHPRDNFVSVDMPGKKGIEKVFSYTNGSKPPNHIGAGWIAVDDRKEVFNREQRLHSYCTVFQAEICDILLAVYWILKQHNQLISSMLTLEQHNQQ